MNCKTKQLYRSLVGMLAGVGALSAAEGNPEQVEFFEKKVRPVLVEKCYRCHSVESGKSRGGLLVDDREALLKGGDTGPAVTPGKPDKSLLITAITYKDKDLQMPPKGERLADADIAALTEWVKMGAPDPRKPVEGKLSGLTAKARQHWAFQPVGKPAPPAVKNRTWPLTPVDAFILSKIEQAGMVPSPLAEKPTLLRRATFDLTGLPPTPQELEEFLKDSSPYAFAKVVDRLLKSPAYGERWGRFWLDTARYADTTGDREVATRQGEYRYPYAWTYRDYVVRAFNEDKPYNRFVLEQLAADLLPDLGNQRDLAALGFLTVGRRVGKLNDVIDDRIDVISRGFQGLTVACARCHDHMFDPIPTKDYYAIHGILASSAEPSQSELPLIPGEQVSEAGEYAKAVASIDKENRQMFYELVSSLNGEFRKRAADYVEATMLHFSDSSAEQQASEGIVAALKLDTHVLGALWKQIEQYQKGVAGDRKKVAGDFASRVYPREDGILVPMLRFLGVGKDAWADVAREISENRVGQYHPLLVAGFQGKPPRTKREVAAVYGRVLASVEGKAGEFVRFSASAIGKESFSERACAATKDEQRLLSTPFRVLPAFELSSEQIQAEVAPWREVTRNLKMWKFNQLNLLKMKGSAPRAMVLGEALRPKNSHVLIRGQSGSPGAEVPRGYLSILSSSGGMTIEKGSGRLELAQCIADRRNPLTARVMVNRVWMHHFGEGFVRTLDDLGVQGEHPTHPELLDYLSSYFMEQGWSIKALHKMIMLSKIYQVSSFTIPAHEVVDPFNRLLWRANVRRIEFEAVRDSLLAYSGQLDRTQGGAPVNITDEPYSLRRSVYGYIDRGNLPELMAHFDFSDPLAPNSRRATSVGPQQALFFLNSPMAIDVACRITARPEVAKARDNASRVINLYRILFQRDPKPVEMALALEFVGQEIRQEPATIENGREILRKTTPVNGTVRRGSREEVLASVQNSGGGRVERRLLTPWETYVHTLLLSNEMVYLN